MSTQQSKFRSVLLTTLLLLGVGLPLNSKLFSKPAMAQKLSRRISGQIYKVQNQWGGSSAPWQPGGTWGIGGRSNQNVVALNISSNDGGMSLFGTMTYSGEGPIGFRAAKE